MEARDIKRYLADLGAALKNRGVKKPLRMMLITMTLRIRASGLLFVQPP